MKYIKGNLLTYDKADVICQQNNCWTRKPHGLSKVIQEKFPYVRLYANRLGKTPNIANEPDEPGKCHLFTKEKSVTVACLLGQWRPGVPGKWNHVYPEHEELNDTFGQRQVWFSDALDDMAKQLDSGRTWVVAFPYKIGCGLAGGNWEHYLDIIEQMESAYNHIEVHIVVLPSEYRTAKRKVTRKMKDELDDFLKGVFQNGKYVQYDHKKMKKDIVDSVEELGLEDDLEVDFDIPLVNVHSSGTDIACDIISTDLNDIFVE